jgi:inorganic pyrophosphatase
MLEMEDEAGIDTKIIALPKVKVDPMQAHIQTMDDIPETEKNKIRHFFDHYKDLEKDKWVKTKDFLGKDAAIEAIKKSIV